jgi:hypothetical protein
MIYYATHNEQGEYTGFYTEEIHGKNIPTPNIQLTEDQWIEANNSRCKVVNGEHTQNPITEDELLEVKYVRLRSERDFLLKQSDWTQFSDSPLTTEKKAEWALYRQALRDLPSNANINNVVFPTEPQ